MKKSILVSLLAIVFSTNVLASACLCSDDQHPCDGGTWCCNNDPSKTGSGCTFE